MLGAFECSRQTGRLQASPVHSDSGLESALNFTSSNNFIRQETKPRRPRSSITTNGSIDDKDVANQRETVYSIMASGDNSYKNYRMENAVPDNFHCAICLNVLKQPMQCVRNEHSFCHPCILRHLQEHKRCPNCMEPLTSETLRPSRVIANLISQLKIQCDNVDRGCPERMKLESLKEHVQECGFRPVDCSNDGCAMFINRKDQLHHENNECHYRKAKCEDCGKDVPYAKRKLHCYVTRKELDETRAEVSGMKETMMKLSRDMSRHMARMSQQMADFNRRINDLSIQLNEVKGRTNKEAQCTKEEAEKPQSPVHPPDSPVACAEQDVNTRSDIIIAGGGDLNSVELFNWTTKRWTPLPAMSSKCWLSSSFVHQGRMFVCGGIVSNSMEVLQLGEEGAQWEDFPAKLLRGTYGHASVVYQDSVFIFGGYSGGKRISDIYKICLVPPYSSQLVSHMPEPTAFHGAQLFGDKVVVVGGTTTGGPSGYVNTVLVYDITNNCCQILPPLPFAVCGMATVAWKDNIIVLGGWDKDNNQLDTVVSYNTEEETSKMLPSMKHRRAFCTAVVTKGGIVVMGGTSKGQWHKKERSLNSVEWFCFNNFAWEELPPMKEKRCGPTAIVTC